MDTIAEHILQRRMHGLYLSRGCGDLGQLSRELLGMHCWFHRNVAFSALIRGASLTGWKHTLTKTWLYRGTLHGVAYDQLPLLLALHPGESYLADFMGEEALKTAADRVLSLMEDGVFSRAEMRPILLEDYDKTTVDALCSPWGGIFVHLARMGKVAFRDMASRDFDLIDAEPTLTVEEALSPLLKQFFTAYGPATLEDAAWFFGFQREAKKVLESVNLEEFDRFEYNRQTYYDAGAPSDMGDIPPITLLSGFDPLIVSYVNRQIVLPQAYKKAVIMKSGICLPTVAIHGQVAGLWNIKNKEPVVDFFTDQPKPVRDAVYDMVESIRWRTMGQL